MSAKIRRAGVRGVKLLAASLFVFLMLFNIQLAFDTGSVGDIRLLGLKLSALVPSAIASGDLCGGTCGWCTCSCYWNGLAPTCFDSTVVRNCCGCPGAACNPNPV
jgi:hypothetical protein